jgi:hypothetical protein
VAVEPWHREGDQRRLADRTPACGGRKDIEGTDAADAIKEWGEGAHKRLERQIQGAARYVVSTA